MVSVRCFEIVATLFQCVAEMYCTLMHKIQQNAKVRTYRFVAGLCFHDFKMPMTLKVYRMNRWGNYLYNGIEKHEIPRLGHHFLCILYSVSLVFVVGESAVAVGLKTV